MNRIFLAFIFALVALTSCRRVDPIPTTVVDKDKFYRSGQPDLNELNKLITRDGIRTIINLRGEHPGEKWFDDEFALTESKQITFISLDFQLKQIPHRRTLLAYLDAIETAPRPILIHCDNGVERTGEAAAIYEMVVNKKSKAEAMKMLSKTYYYAESDDPSKKYFIEKVWQSEDWARNEYDPCVQNFGYYPHTLSECADRPR